MPTKTKTRELPTELGIQYRSYKLNRKSIDEEARTVELSFSSETPADRWYGQEILDHSPGAVRMGRLEDGAALLREHLSSNHIGTVEEASIGGDRLGRATVRFSKSAKGQEAWEEVQDGTLHHVSVGYRVHRMRLEEESDQGPDVYRVIDWEPVEISLVAVPLDPTVGVGRSAESNKQPVIIENRSTSVPKTASQEPAKPATPPQPAAAPEADPTEIRTAVNQAVEDERTRSSEIRALGRMHNQRDLAEKFVDEGRSLNEFQVELLKKNAKPVDTDAGRLGMDDKEKKRFSFARLLSHLSEPNEPSLREAAAFELEVCAEGRKLHTGEVRGHLIPFDVLEFDVLGGRSMRMPGGLQRDLNVGTSTAGGHTVATDLMAGDFIEILVNQSAVLDQAQMLTGLRGNVAIPRQTGAVTAYWVAEAGSATASDPAFNQLTMSPKTVTARSGYTRSLLLQSELAIEQFLRMDLAQQLTLAVDDGLLNGDGTGNTMTGLRNFSGIGSVAIGTNGGAPTWGTIIDLKTEVAVDNALMINGRPNNVGYLFNAATEGTLQQTQITPTYGDRMIVPAEGGRVAGYGYRVSNQLPSNLTKGSGTNLSSAVFANWYEQIVGMWGGLDVMVDPYTNSHTGSVRVSAFLSVDTGARHAEAFASCDDIVTT